MNPETRTLRVDYLARVEGEGALHLEIEGGRVTRAELAIFEPPRYFEALLRGRDFHEAPDITARICGICPVAYMMSACQAIEDACGVALPPTIQDLRRVLYCGEWIESHGLHVHLLHLPDFLGFPDAVQMARAYPEAVRRGLRLKKLGNALVEAVGGRAIHPVNVRLGGFYRAPPLEALQGLIPELTWAIEAAEETIRFVADLDFPDFEVDYEFIALVHPDEYPMNAGRLTSSRGGDWPVSDFPAVLTETHVSHSTALQSRRPDGTPVLMGPLARYALNRERLTPRARVAAAAAGLGTVCRNPYQAIVVRAVEILLACEEALRLIKGYAPFEPAALAVMPRAGEGHGATEAPRGTLYHHYRIAADGTIDSARIVPPTAVNQARIEADLVALAQANLDLADDRLRALCEQAIRSYDPCISCATHFLKLDVVRHP